MTPPDGQTGAARFDRTGSVVVAEEGVVDWSIGNLTWIVIGGAIIGIIARLVLPGRQRIPFWLVLVAGIVGMFVGDAVAGLLGVEETGGFDWIRHGLQVLVGVGAVALAAALAERRTAGAPPPSSPPSPPPA